MSNENQSPVAASFDRRGLFRLGGLTVAGAAILAACGQDPAGELGRVGTGATTTALPDAKVNNGVLLRTAASLELSMAAAYDRMLKGGHLAGSSATLPNLGDQTALVTAFAKQHTKNAETFNQLAQEKGAEAFTCGNPRLDSAFIDVIFDRVDNGVAATDNAPAIDKSDDPTRDMINLVWALESLSAASCQALVPLLEEPAHRAESMRIGARSARQSALVALRINPGQYVTVNDAEAANPGSTIAPTSTGVPATTPSGSPYTDIPLPVAIPTQFGSLAATTYVGGNGDVNGVRLKLNFETPSLNSYVYDYVTCG